MLTHPMVTKYTRDQSDPNRYAPTQYQVIVDGQLHAAYQSRGDALSVAKRLATTGNVIDVIDTEHHDFEVTKMESKHGAPWELLNMIPESKRAKVYARWYHGEELHFATDVEAPKI